MANIKLALTDIFYLRKRYLSFQALNLGLEHVSFVVNVTHASNSSSTGQNMSFSLPSIDQLIHLNIGLWVWSMPDNSLLNSSNEQINLDHHVWIARRDCFWSAGCVSSGQCMISGIWGVNDRGDLDSENLLSVSGKYAASLNSLLRSSQKSDRIWSYLQGQATTMVLRSKNAISPLAIDEIALRISSAYNCQSFS